MYEVVNFFATDKVDLIVLNRADPLLQKEVALYGKPIFEAEENAFDHDIKRNRTQKNSLRSLRHYTQL